ncbi:MAG: ABC transporter substrate-binding protein [Deltaproteobacteria bacterium]|nr:ABC transporter substrate-binding protein [Deltaproteobacteria bacterium]
MTTLKILLVSVFLTMSLSAAALADKGPTDYLKSLDGQIKPLLTKSDQNKVKILKIVKKMLDFNRLCKDSLGKHWETRTPEEQKDFTETLTALIEKNVLKRLTNTKDNEVKYESENVKGDTATVITLVSDTSGPRPVEIEIAYKMEKKGKNWIVVDMKTDGISLVSNYRSQFNKLIEKEGWDSMMKKMKDKLAE